MDNYYSKYMKPGEAQYKRTDTVDYFTDDDRQRK